MKLARLLLVMLLLSACSQQSILEKFASPKDQALAKHTIELLKTGQYEALEASVDPSYKNASLRAALEKMAALIPKGEPTSVKLVGAHTSRNSSGTSSNIVYEYQYGSQWLLMSVSFLTSGDTTTLTGFHVIPRDQSLEAENRFTLSGKSPLQYAVLAWAVFAVVLSFYALIVCLRSRLISAKWLWVLFIMIGLGELKVNWTTGQWNFHPIAFQLFSASAFGQLYGPWVIAISLPLGAILFLIRRKSLLAPEIEPPAEPPEAV